MFKVGIIGAAGFSGQELMRILAKHERVQLSYLTSGEYQNKKVCEVFPSLCLPSLQKQDAHFLPHPQKPEDIPSLDFAFTATPDAASLQLIPWLLQKNIRVIDIAGIFRLHDIDVIAKVYNLQHNQPQLLQEAVYGLPELYAAEISKARLVANPGCYATSALLPLVAVKDFLPQFLFPVIVDAKSGTSGAGGRKEKDGLSYSSVNENFRAYKVALHQHQPEIEQYARAFSKVGDLRVRFTPHLLPLERGIFSTLYLHAKDDSLDSQAVQKACARFAEQNTFARFYENPNDLQIKHTACTNFADFSFYWDKENQTLILLSVIDNLLKGAAGQAVQNFNLMSGQKISEALL